MVTFTDKYKQELRDGGLTDDEIHRWELIIPDENDARDGGLCSTCKHDERCDELGKQPFPDDSCPWGEYDPKE